MTKVKTDSRPLYILVKEKIEELISDGTFSEGDRLPSENTLAENLGVSRATLREALRVMEEEGKVIRQQGVGTFVASRLPKIQKGIEDLYSVTETIKSHGFEPGTVGYKIWEEKMGRLAPIFEEDPDTLMWVIERIRTADKNPVVYCKDHLPQNIIAEMPELSHYGSGESIFQVLEEQYHLRITYAVARIIPMNAPNWLADKLKIPVKTPVLLLEQKHYDHKDRMILFSRNYFRNEFEFHVVRRRR
ncbi:hypothetical protein BBF96_02900 [Anoxybacter fermentans]|uniref:HTH gntR-type domain-containing protein n=1 Tax=Anoxybacter fermentans TaxID=1323375 RepID=A0A3Q9HPE8_9FIRM|nr:GntR family transcriptional regulator [Anoxybacter fermentans]AZR72433.1 hypothetical protein BBF96_02900 [Anoxybacter fermentans]